MLRRVFAVIGFLLLLQGAALVVAFMATGEMVLNTDVTAPISQLQLLRDGMVADLRELRLARIPSFVPDLLVLKGLISLEGPGREGGAVLQAQFALVMALLLLGLQTRIVMLATSLGRWISLAAVLAQTLVLLRVSPLDREAAGLALSPVHHGGNVILTLLAVVLLAGLVRPAPRRNGSLHWLLLLVLVFLGTASNLLFLATGVLPLAITLASHPAANASVHRGLRLAALMASALGGLAATRAFNLQCAMEAAASFRPVRLLEAYQRAPLVPVALLLAVALLVLVARGRGGSVAQMVALAVLSPLVYTPFVAEIPARYVLVSVLLVPVMVPLLLVPRPQGRSHPVAPPPQVSPLRLAEASLACLAAAAFLSISLLGPPADRLAANLRAREDPAQRRLVAALVDGGHRHGLAGFWGTSLNAVSAGSLDVQPINGDGEADLWAHNREAFLQPLGKLDRRSPTVQQRSLKPYSFVVVNGEDEHPTREDVVKAYGSPAGSLGCSRGDGNGFCVLLYDDPTPIQRALAGKLRDFDNRCSQKGNLR